MSAWQTFLLYYNSSVNDTGSLLIGVWFIAYLVLVPRNAFFQANHRKRFYIVLTLALVGHITSTAIPMTLVLWLGPTRLVRKWRRQAHKTIRQSPTRGSRRGSWLPVQDRPHSNETSTRRKCSSCSDGTVTCTGCRSGRVSNPNSGPPEIPHFTCGGTGRLRCSSPRCNGGWIDG